MYKKDFPLSTPFALRQKAEMQLKNNPVAITSQLTEEEVLALAHELEVYHLEIEMQNEELQAAKDQATASEARWHAEFFNLSPTGFVILTDTGEIIEVNRCLAQMLGKESKSLNTSQFGFFILTGSRPGFTLFIEKLFSTQVNQTYEAELEVEGCLPIWVLLTGIVMNNGVHCMVNVTDITGRKREQQEAQQSVSRLEHTIKSAHMAWWEMDIKTGNVVFSKTKTDMLGYAQDEFTHYTQFMALVHPDDYDNAMNAMRGHFSGKFDVYEVEYRILSKEGGYLWFYDHGAIIQWDLDGKPMKIVGYVINITRRKQAELDLSIKVNQHRNILQTAMDGYWMVDIEGHLLEVNDSYCQMSGYSAEELLSMSVQDLQVEISADEDAARVKMVMAKGEYRFESQQRRKDGSIFDVEISIQHQTATDGLAVVFVHDITKRKQADQDLRKAKEKAEESDRLKSAFLANMSHEIRTPMNGILGFAELLKEPGLSGVQQQEYVRIIKKSGDRMLNIINNIVDISKIESGQMQVIESSTDINEQIRFIISFFKPEAEHKGLQIRSATTLQGKQAIIRTDREKLYAILTNLVKNAIKYSDTGFIEIGYTLKPAGKPAAIRGSFNYMPSDDHKNKPSELEFFVTDKGIGVPKDRQQAIFDRFIQADIADKRAFQGAGLGLSISKAYVEMLGGQIRVVSDETAGSTFYFTIPYTIGPSDEKTASRSTDSKIPAHHIKAIKILIVEDDETSSMLIVEAVKKFSREILLARTGKEAIETCHNHPDIDLIMMDIQMPELNGFAATRQIREFNNEVIIIAQTAFGMDGDRKETLEAGCDDYISKPITQDVLHSLIIKHFQL